MNSNPKRYHWTVVSLHWLTAIAIMMMLIFGTFLTGATPNSDPEKLNHLRGHMTIGGVILVLMLLRVVSRFFSTAPAHVSSNSAGENKLAGIVHIVLYILVFMMLGSGIAMSVMTNLPDIVFNGIGQLPTDFKNLTPRTVHGLASKLLALLIVLHIAAALKHQLIKKDKLIARMWFGRR